MSEGDARAWWADVEHLRERIERRREQELDHRDREHRGHRSARSAGPVYAAASAPARRPAPEPYEDDATGFRPRRTVRIRGQAIPTVTAPRLHPVDVDHAVAPRPDRAADAAADAQPARPRRPRRRPAERLGPNPDRLALWAFVLGLTLVLAALLSSHGL